MAQKARLDLVHNQGTESYGIIGRNEMCDYWYLFHLFKMVLGFVLLDAANGVAKVTRPREWTKGDSLDIVVKYGYFCDKKGKLVIAVMLVRIMNWC